MKSPILSIGLMLVLILAAATAAQAQAAGPLGARPVGTAVATTGFGDMNNYVADFGGGPELVPVRGYCRGYWVRGHYNRWGDWVPAHRRYGRWIPGHHNRWGRWVPGHCA